MRYRPKGQLTLQHLGISSHTRDDRRRQADFFYLSFHPLRLAISGGTAHTPVRGCWTTLTIGHAIQCAGALADKICGIDRRYVRSTPPHHDSTAMRGSHRDSSSSCCVARSFVTLLCICFRFVNSQKIAFLASPVHKQP